MRNIKTSLRFARNSALLFTAASGLFYMTACSSEENLVNNDQNDIETPAENGAYTVYGANPNRVHNFGTDGTRAAIDGFTMPEAVVIPDDALDLNGKYLNEANSNEWYQDWRPCLNYGTPAAGTYYIAAGETTNSGLQLNGDVTIYVAGTLNMAYLGSANQNTIYILEGGKVVLPSALTPGVTVYNYGDVKDAEGGVTIGEGAKLYSAVDIDCGIFGVNAGAELYCKGSIHADKVRLNGNAIACAFVAKEEMTLNDYAVIKTGYFKAKNLTLNASSVVLDNNGLLDAENLFLSNADSRFVIEPQGTNAVIHAAKFDTNNVTWAKNTFAANIALDFGTCYIAGVETPHNDFGFQVSDENHVVYVPSTSCHGEFGTKPTEETPGATEDPGDETITVPEIVKVTEIDPLDEEINHGNHDHGVISATCINFAGNVAYASYHLRGEGQKGCIEVIKDNGSTGLALSSYMISPDYDFNHLIVDGNKIVTVGNHAKKAAFVGMLPIDFEASEGVRTDFYVKELTTDEVIYAESEKEEGKQIAAGYKNAGDGNCIVKYGDNYLFTAYRGYGAITADSLRKVNGTFVPTTGSCKHIALNGDKAVVLALDTYDKTSSTASVYSWSLSNGSFANVLAQYDQIGTVAPVDGKNVVAFDGDDIYACLSQGGLARIKNGQVEVKNFGTNGKIPANGMAIDEKYIYLAAGSFVYVLDKASMEEVCHYYAETKKSANYIALNNGKIYVAYGEDGIMAFQLVEKTIEL